MKKMILILGILTISIVKSQTIDLYTNVTNLWFQGHKTNVLEIGQQRLNINSNDLVGLIIQESYNQEFLQLESSSNTLQKILLIGGTITNENFKIFYPKFKEYIESDLDALAFFAELNFSPEELAVEKAKGLIAGKPFPYSKELEALQKDGLCAPLVPPNSP